ncbi:Pentatricopeptide repeat-containing protein [Thalictrum thalictroides]|uniref:Pentatricopeptide repeat-containing protein n=1 Tax=Thalictrum thalictroides TaxID=46969 RepID=A0A7J6VX65_THATH|nr:Pentatricopeptide repeat-containing protein [Thalictrum thalictroides]
MAARISSFPSFVRRFSPFSTTSTPDNKHKYYRATTICPASTSLGYTHNKNHNHNINLEIQNLSRRCQSRRQFFQLQAHFISSGLFQHPFPASYILKLSLNFAHLDHTVLIFQHIHSPDTFCVNTVLKAFSSHPHLAPLFYFSMLAKGFHPNSFTFPPLFISCANSHSTDAGFICHAQSIKYGFHSVVPVQNSLIHMYASFDLIHSASCLFDAMPERDIISWNSMIHGYIKVGVVTVAHLLFDKMPTKNVVSWNIMISGYLKTARNPGCGLKLFREMTMIGFRGNDTTFVSVLTACGRSARLKEGRSVHGSLVKNFVKPTVILDTALIDMYSKCQKVEAARRVFNKMLVRNLVSWNAIILAYCIHGCPEDGLTMYHEMIGRVNSDDDVGEIIEGSGGKKFKSLVQAEKVVLPDEITFVGVLCACARGGRLLDGKNYFNQMLSVYSIRPKFAHYWCMANLYYGLGLIQEAEEVLRSMPEDEDIPSDSLVWINLLGSCRFHGDIELGVQIAMRLIELEPQNKSHYTLLSNIYAVAGRWEEAAKVKKMFEEKGLRKIGGCSLVDLSDMVHDFLVGDELRPGMDEVYTMLAQLVRKLRLSTNRFTISHS